MIDSAEPWVPDPEAISNGLPEEEPEGNHSVPCEQYRPFKADDPNAQRSLFGELVCQHCGWTQKAHGG